MKKDKSLKILEEENHRLRTNSIVYKRVAEAIAQDYLSVAGEAYGQYDFSIKDAQRYVSKRFYRELEEYYKENI